MNRSKISIKFAALLIFCGSFLASRADEGMWLPMLIERLNHVDMQKMGLKLTAEEIYSVNNSSLKDAIIQFGNGCTGEIVSVQGLVLTNHHCGYGQIQAHSTPERDYLTNGFWAMNMKEELPNEGLTASFLIRMEDVTKTVLEGINGKTTEKERRDKVSAAIKKLMEDNSENKKYRVEVKPFFEGNEYYMFVYQVYMDVRLVGAPPSSIGKYGADTDNWMWPRHTGDFSIFRIYGDQDGNPAPYHKDNLPIKPKHALPINIGGLQKGDFSMILGFPGSTDRYLTSFGINQSLEEVYPSRIKIRRAKLDIMMANMEADPKVRIQYASKYAQTSNYWKNFIGMSRGLKRLGVSGKKSKLEQQLTFWIDQYPSRKDTYGPVVNDIKQAYAELAKYDRQRYYFIEAIVSEPEVIRFSRSAEPLLKLLSAEQKDQALIDRNIQGLRKMAERLFKDYNMPTDRAIFAEMMKMFYKEVAPAHQPAVLAENVKKYKGDYTKWAEKVYAKSIFTDPVRFNAFLDKPTAKAIEKDPIFILMKAFYDNYFEKEAKLEEYNEKLGKAKRLFIDGLRKMQVEKTFYPDANFTMRLTYGQVLDYYPADAVYYNWFTTLDGVMDKEDPNNWEFVVAPKLKELWKAKDYGRYAENGVMKVCFLTNHDITGGNSGSPVINAHGELIGLAFDGNWEAMSGDIAFEPELQRTINVDIRYVLFIIEKYAGAKHLVDEMKVIEKRH